MSFRKTPAAYGLNWIIKALRQRLPWATYCPVYFSSIFRQLVFNFQSATLLGWNFLFSINWSGVVSIAPAATFSTLWSIFSRVGVNFYPITNESQSLHSWLLSLFGTLYSQIKYTGFSLIPIYFPSWIIRWISVQIYLNKTCS